MSVKEKYLKVYIDSDNTVQVDKDMNIRFRPRKDKYLTSVGDGDTKEAIFVGLHCNNSSYKHLGGLNLAEETDDEGVKAG